jgi:pimeloyl-ACP methyl ester carboxylesterase
MIGRLLFGGSVAALAGLKLYSDRAIRRAEAEHPPAGRFVAVDGARLHYLSSGSGQPVVLLHASGLALQDFALSIFDQVAAAHQAIAFDRPGYGYSERPAGEPLTLALNARLIHDALQSLGIEQPILVGNSYGGSVALRYALDYPDQIAGLVLLAPSAYAEGLSVPAMFSIPDVPVLGSLFLHTLVAPLARLVTPMFVAGLFAPNAPPAAYAETMRTFTVRPGQFRAWADELTHLGAGLRVQSHRYDEIRVPVVIVAGAADRVDPPEVQAYPLHRAIAQSQLVVLKQTGHAVHHAHPEAALAAIRRVRPRERAT